MKQEVIIGREGNQPFPITQEGVSRKHALLTIDDNQNWWIENLTTVNGNGLYIRDEQGDFHPIEAQRISEDSVLRLGPTGYMSCTFMAHRAIAPQGDYSYEFRHLRRRIRGLRQEMENLNENNQKRSKLANKIRLVSYAISVGIVVVGAISGASLMAMSPMIFPGLIGVLSNTLWGPKTQEARDLQQKITKFQVCPNCGRPISQHDVENLRCSACKAK